jgi:hypothetical protein
MFKHFFVVVSIGILLLNAGCSGPSITHSDTSREEHPVGIAKDGQEKRGEETLAAGTVVRASFESSLSTDSNISGDPFTMKVVDSVKVDDKTLIPIGSTIRGVVAESVRSGRVKGRAHMTLRFTDLILPNGKAYAIQTSSVSHMAPSTKKRDGMMIGGGAGLGAIIGAVAGGGKGAAIGAAAGAGAGTGAVLATRGKETGFAAGSTLSVKLTQPLTLS